MKITTIFFLIIFLMITSLNNLYSQQDVNGWFWLNGQPTGNTLKWVKIIDPANIYAVGKRGTFMKSNDGGDTWSINSQVGAPNIELATLDLNCGWFFDANTGIVAGQSLNSTPGYISRTTDGGTTWNYIQYNDSGGTVNGIYFIDSNTGFLCGGTRARVHKTSNGGITWTDISAGLDPTTVWNSVYAFNSNKIIVTTTSNQIFTTTNNGTNWAQTTLPGTFTTITDIFFKDANTGYVCGNGNYFAYTLNGGTNWTQSNPPSAYGQRRIKYHSGIVYLVGAYTEIFQSSDNGISWNVINFFDGSNPNQPSQFTMYGIDVNGSDIAVIGTDGIVNLSNDGGASWRNKNYAVYPTATTYSSLYTESNTNRIWVGTGTGGGNLLYSTNGGTNWTTQSTSHTTSVFDIDFVNSSTGFIAGGSLISGIGQFSKTTNGGNNWTMISLSSPMSTSQINSIDFADANTGWAAGYTNPSSPVLITKTTNGGVSWNSQALETNPLGPGIGVQMANANTGYVLASTGLWRTANGGTNWIKNTNPFVTSTVWTNMYVLYSNVIFLNGLGTGNLKKVVRSTDGGNSWSDITGNILNTVNIFRCQWLNVNHGIVCGTNGYTAETTNGGLIWNASNPGFSTTVDLAFPKGNYWYTISDRNSAFQIGRKVALQSNSSASDTFRIAALYAMGKVPINAGTPDSIQVRAISSFATFIDKSITMRVYNDSNVHCCPYVDDPACLSGTPKELTLASFDGAAIFDTTISFKLSDFGLKENDLIIVSAVPGDTSRPYFHSVTNDEWNYKDPCLPDDNGEGFDGKTGNMLVALRNRGNSSTILKSVDHTFYDSVGGGFAPYRVVIYADNGSGKPGTLLHISPALTSPAGTGSAQTVSYNLNYTVSISSGSRFYVGLRQTSGTNIKMAYQNENPVRKNSFYFSSPDTTGNWYDFSDSAKNIRPDISVKIQYGQLSLTSLVEGFFNGSTMVRDTMRVFIRNSSAPYSLIDSSKAYLDQNGFAVLSFSNISNGSSYYLQLKHRNSLSTWSQNAQTFNSGNITYDFTTSGNQAYGNNMTLKLGKYCIYSGDVNNDGTISLTDVLTIYNSAITFSSGYVLTDLNGDNYVDLSDITYCFNNASAFVAAITP